MSLTNTLKSQNDLLLENLLKFYSTRENLQTMVDIANSESRISLRMLDWFVTNYAKKYYTVYEIPARNRSSVVINDNEGMTRFKVFNQYKLELKSYSKLRFDPFCRRERIHVPYDDEQSVVTTIGQLNFFKWAIENGVIDYIDRHYDEIEADMTANNSTTKRKTPDATECANPDTKTRKKREELSISACKSIKKETVKIVVKFN
jgi:hypothetical protein